MSKQIVFRTKMFFKNSESFKYMKSNERADFKKKTAKIDKMINSFNLLSESLEIPQKKIVKKAIIEKQNKIDTRIEVDIFNLNADIKDVMARVNKNAA